MSNTTTSQNGQSQRGIDIENQIIKNIMTNDQVFRGMTYSQFLREWLIWLFSSSPSYEGYRDEICFLTGNISYAYNPDTGERKQVEKAQNRARMQDSDDFSDTFFRGEVVFPDTAIFFPVISAFYSVGEKYYGKTLDTLRDCQNVCRRDIDEGGRYWCTIKKKEGDEIDLEKQVVPVESPSVQITVTEDSLLKDRFEMPIAPGTYETFCVAKVLMIKGLPIGDTDNDMSEYRLHYGGYGRGAYVSDSYVDIIVSSEGRRALGSQKLEERRAKLDLNVPKAPKGLLKF